MDPNPARSRRRFGVALLVGMVVLVAVVVLSSMATVPATLGGVGPGIEWGSGSCCDLPAPPSDEP